MDFPYFKGTQEVTSSPEKPAELPASRHADRIVPKNYIASSGLANAVNTALLLGKPLLLTGEPGVGKTQLAHRVAWELGLGDPLSFSTKSNSVASDLFYRYDSLGRFHAAQLHQRQLGPQIVPASGKIDGVAFIHFEALGEAIIRTNRQGDYEDYLPEGFKPGYEKRSVVLIDEVDKAPRDFPNDILNEIENLSFRIPELGNMEVRANEEFTPILIITSNSEKSLPDAFLRRCIFHHIEFPTREQLSEIALLNLKSIAGKQPGNSAEGRDLLIADAIDLFFELRESGLLKKKPSTSELLLWLESMVRIFPSEERPLIQGDPAQITGITLNTLFKYKQDQDEASQIVTNWLENQKT